MDKITAIETVYKGYHYRSRLEARWAVFFDALNIPYEYEREGYDLGDAGRYLPDFWLPEQRYWIEVKGQEPTQEERLKALRLAQMTGHRVCIFEGQIATPNEPDYPSGYALTYHPFYKDILHTGIGLIGAVGRWFECSACHKFFMASDTELVYNIPGPQPTGCPYMPDEEATGDPQSKRLIAAYTAARSARFEHGEKGRTV